MLLSLISDLHTLFHPNPRNVPARSVHQKCLALMISQIIVGCPIKHIERYIESLTSTDETQGPKKLGEHSSEIRCLCLKNWNLNSKMSNV